MRATYATPAVARTRSSRSRRTPAKAADLQRCSDAATRAKIEALMLRDGVSLAEFLARAADAYALMLPGWPYDPRAPALQ